MSLSTPSNSPFHGTQLLCPICLSRSSTTPSTLKLNTDQRSLICSNNHSFDIAKQGYVNLLPVQQKKSANPGDSKEMVLARKQFLELGYYLPLADALVDAVKQTLPQANHMPVILDAGCGEGYYTDHLQRSLCHSYPDTTVYGFDIAKPAMIEAAKRNKSIINFVSTIKAIPLPRHYCDVIFSVFSPLQTEQLHQTLKADGTLIVLSAGKNHLQQLKALLYDEVSEYNEDKFLSQLASHFTLFSRSVVQQTMNMNSRDDILSLLAMTPHFWRASPDAKKRLDQYQQLAIDIDVQLMVFKPRHDIQPMTLTVEPATNE